MDGALMAERIFFSTRAQGNGRWLIVTDRGNHAIVNEGSRLVLEALRDVPDPAFAYEYYAARSAGPVDRLAFARAVSKLTSQLFANGPEKKSARDYLLFRRPLLSTQMTRVLARPFLAAFYPLVFAALALAAAFTVGSEIFRSIDAPSCIAGISIFTLVPLVLASVLIHELGHVAACRFAGAPHGGIGFGIYLVFPVFYSDLTMAYGLSRKRRMLVDVGGVYLQLVFAAALELLAQIPALSSLHQWVVVVIAMALPQLIPFVRNDGYWLLSDFLDVPNLGRFDRTMLSDLKNSDLHRRYRARAKLAYVAANVCVSAFFIAYAAIGYKTVFVALPAGFVTFLSTGVVPQSLANPVTLLAALFAFAAIWQLARIARFIIAQGRANTAHSTSNQDAGSMQ